MRTFRDLYNEVRGLYRQALSSRGGFVFNMQAPIGIFDSGVGGLTVAAAIMKELPQETFIYYGDTAHAPYGDKSSKSIVHHSETIVQFLEKNKCKAIVIACNTASAVAYGTLLRKFPDLLIINVIDPVVHYVAGHAHGRVGIIATRATTQSRVYLQRLHRFAPHLQAIAKATPLFAPIVEEGFENTDISRGAIREYLCDKEWQNLDTLILGCTHYPLLQREIEDFYENKTQVIDSPRLVAKALGESLGQNNLLADRRGAGLRFYFSEKTRAFETIARRFFGARLSMEEFPLMG